MAGNLTDTAENLLLDALHALTGTVTTAPLRLRVLTTTGTDAAAGTEVTGGSYTTPTITMGAASGGTASNTNAITVTGMPACTVTGFEVWDSAGTPRRLWAFPAAATKTVNAGDTFSVAAGAITVSLD